MDTEMEYPISNEAYNLLSVLTSKLEALGAYHIYLQDDMDDEARKAIEKVEADDRQHVEFLIDQVEKHIRTYGLRPRK